MKVALIGATGKIGANILEEALNRGHTVTAIVRNAGKLADRPGLVKKACEIHDTAALAAVLQGHEAVISAFNPALENGVAGAKSIISAVKAAQVPRLLVVGGAGSMQGKDGVQLVDTPEMPRIWLDHALATREVLNLLWAEDDLDWTFLAPAMLLEPGERTGRFRISVDTPVETEDDGPSRISFADYALAMIDELENPRHTRQRFTVGY